MQSITHQASPTLTVNVAFASLGMRRNTLYEVLQVVSQHARDASWTDDTDWAFAMQYGTDANGTTLQDVRRCVASHEHGLRSRAAAGVEWQPKTFQTIQTLPSGLLVPQLFIGWNSTGAAVAVRHRSVVYYQVVRVSHQAWLNNIKLWDIDTDQEVNLPQQFVQL